MSGYVPERVRWGVELLGVAPQDEILEIGCGPGVAVGLVCEKLAGGRITAIDRSATAINRAGTRNAAHVAAGRAVLRQVDLAAFSAPGQRFDKVFAINVNLFWARPGDPELAVLTRHLRPGGTVHLIYETPTPERSHQVAEAVAETLAGQGLRTEVIPGTLPALAGVRAQALPAKVPRRRT